MVGKRRGGYTLTEMMVVVAIIGVVTSATHLVMSKTIQAQMMTNALADIQMGAFTSFDTISKLLRQADSSSIVIDRYDASQPPWSRISFTIPNRAQTFTFYQKGQVLYFGGVSALKNLRSVTFAYPNSATSNVISLSMTFEKSTGSGRTKAIQLYIQKVKVQN